MYEHSYITQLKGFFSYSTIPTDKEKDSENCLHISFGFFYITVSVLFYLFHLFLVFDFVWWTELITCPALSTHYMFASCYISLEFPIWVSHYSLHISARLVPLMRTLERLQNTGCGHARCIAITPVPLTEEHYPDGKHCTACMLRWLLQVSITLSTAVLWRYMGDTGSFHYQAVRQSVKLPCPIFYT